MQAVLLISLLAFQEAPKIEAKRLSVPADAVALALLDAGNFSDHAIYYRYVWCPANDKDVCAAVDVAVNTVISKSPVLIKGVRIGENRVLRYDLRTLAPQKDDLKTLIDLWEQFEDDEPYFLVNSNVEGLFKDVLVIVTNDAEAMTSQKILGKCTRGEEYELLGELNDKYGLWYEITYKGQAAYVHSEHVKKESRKIEAEAKRVFGPHLGDDAGNLVLATQSQVPVVRHDYFVRKILSTLDGGLYYEFRGIVESPDENVSDLDFFLKEFAGVSIKTVEELRSDQKVAIFRSLVTGKPRATLFFQGVQGRVTTNQGLVVITQDLNDNEVDPAADPLQNLIRHKYQGIELFLELPNGMLCYALFGGDLNGDGKFDPKANEGNLVRSAPDVLVTDHAIPAPHTRRLQPAISCMRCHNVKRGTVQPEGWIPHGNDVTTLLSAGLDVFGERTDGFPDQDTLDRAAGLFTGDLDKTLRRARDDYSEAMLRLTGNPGTAEESTVTVAIAEIVQIYHSYWYDLVTPQVACRELGFEVAEADAAAFLKQILPPLPADEIGVSPEDLRLGALKAGLSINRFQWEAVYADAAYRTIATLLEQNNG